MNIFSYLINASKVSINHHISMLNISGINWMSENVLKTTEIDGILLKHCPEKNRRNQNDNTK